MTACRRVPVWPAKDLVADILTKQLPRHTFGKCHVIFLNLAAQRKLGITVDKTA